MICVSIAEQSVSEAAELIEILNRGEPSDASSGVSSGKTIAEIRIDAIKWIEEQLTNASTNENSDFSRLFSTKTKVIATCRKTDLTEDQRIGLLERAISSGAVCVDVDVENPDLFIEKIRTHAKSAGCKLILSSHNFQKTPPRRELEYLIRWGFDAGADIMKIACLVRNQSDLARLLSLYEIPGNIISIGMGKGGTITRVMAPLLGAPFTYASFSPGKETAPGQVDKDTLKKLLEGLSWTVNFSA
ncbi:MAG: type I 3-dehydroquinate dehydratase [Spirochaetales bacterium]|nr:type I 3-dehydroquinate dehydratase [Spirochaetales bacterium]